jgi:sugar phosphate isomerase/epimerase
VFGDAGITLGCETGQETGPALKAFLNHLDEPNVAINFDPANMLLYNNGDPIEALRLVGPWVRSAHIKDARKTRVPGTWGEEVPVGTGEVDWAAFFRTMADVRFPGWFCIEREAGDQRVEDIRAARRHVEAIVNPA